MSTSRHSLAQLLDASRNWWNAAGVDQQFSDDATVWLDESPKKDAQGSPMAPPPAPSSPAPGARAEPAQETARDVNLLGDEPPRTLEAFHRFWLEAPGLHPGPLRSRIAPRGAHEPALMILVLEPEEDDTDRLLGGPQGRLLSRMLQAMQIDEDDVYIASALPGSTPMADAAAIARAGMSRVLLHHINLLKPPAILGFGSGLRPMLGLESGAETGSLREINHNSSLPPMLLSEALASLIEIPRLKARFWRRWIEWSAQHS